MAEYVLRKDREGKYYWILRSKKSFKKVAMSSESYETKAAALASISWTQSHAPTQDVSDEVS
jgi:uncharacterized protein YegP (UPF0339 family)